MESLLQVSKIIFFFYLLSLPSLLRFFLLSITTSLFFLRAAFFFSPPSRNLICITLLHAAIVADTKVLCGLTGSNKGIQTLPSYSSSALPSLSRLLLDSSLNISSASADALINLSQVSGLASKLVSLGLVLP
jgi:hypothetical protein